MAPPDRIGPYRVVRSLGRGAMGAVYEVEDPQLPRHVALKLLRTRSEVVEERFWREAEILARIRHPNVVKIHRMGELAEGPFLLEELVAGESLRGRIERGRASPEEAARIGRELADALVVVHAAGIVHRDLKPENVMLRASGSPVLLDFGVARDADSERLTKTGAVVGTVAYMAPEQARGSKSIDGRADVYALGAILYELLSGRRPFEDAPMVVLYQILHEAPRALAEHCPALPPGLDAIVQVAMAKDVSQRFADAAALRDDLARFLAGESTEAKPPPPPPASWARAALVGVALLGVALALLAALWPQAHAPLSVSPVASAAPDLALAARELLRDAERASDDELLVLLERAAKLDPAAAHAALRERALGVLGAGGPLTQVERLDPLGDLGPLPLECAAVYREAALALEARDEAGRALACLERAQLIAPHDPLPAPLPANLHHRFREALRTDRPRALAWLFVLTRAGHAPPNALSEPELRELLASRAFAAGDDPAHAYWRGQAERASGQHTEAAASLERAAQGLASPTLRAQARLGRLAARMATGAPPSEAEALWSEAGFPEAWRVAQVAARHTTGAAQIVWLQRQTQGLKVRVEESRRRALPAGATSVSARPLGRAAKKLLGALERAGRADDARALREDPVLGPLVN